ncbi:ubiquinone/menaquinone biosynthesis C-methylase UbiE [Chitinivorax tropicus]|uniref:Ubiquinone/menaquinone biosynthesis C-methylase UbiE n=1 Tax=Chitinivorax tropicus TaxID=714531 RepID=A0A840MKF8_9PROT|nr:class I SAM-dependent methyltransferase [Chitinivorax tropicus]MBB5017192.1 ubiquinone/menaquinone biosynthesis C-methylase UbiE [Chitinivorax tropicus]
MDLIRKYYDQLAREYDHDRFGNSYGRFIDQAERHILSSWLPQTRHAPTADLACGTGRLLAFADIGIDLSANMLAEARQKWPERPLIHATAQQLPLPDESVQTVFAFHLLMHLEPDICARILNEAHRVLKPGGLLILDFPSARRRGKRTRATPAGAWHGSTSYTLQDITHMAQGFRLKTHTGLLWLPIHRLPRAIRSYMTLVDRALSRLMPEWSSYLVICLEKA